VFGKLKAHDWIKLKNREFCEMLVEKSRLFYATTVADSFNTLLEIEAHEEDQRNKIINHKKDMKEFIYQKVHFNKVELLKIMLADLDHVIKGKFL
jgi:predicted methyltransferase